jgi:transcriptional regulator with XRE-family HTH domain
MTESALSRYAGELKAWREKLGVTQPQFADQIGYSPALVAAIEQSRRSPTPAFAKACDAATGAPGTFERWQAQVTAESFPAFFAPVVEFEQAAVRIHGWELGAIPGLLQVERYAEAVILAGYPGDSASSVSHIVTARMERQELMSSEAPMLWYVLHEGVLRHQVGGRAVMVAQLDRLLELIASRRIVLQVLPFTASDHPGVEGPITIFEFPETATIAYTECYGGGRIVEERGEVARLVTVMGALKSCALSPADSATLIRDIRGELHG